MAEDEVAGLVGDGIDFAATWQAPAILAMTKKKISDEVHAALHRRFDAMIAELEDDE